jgi:uncharacterized membrane protein YhaH (DUF805 family)
MLGILIFVLAFSIWLSARITQKAGFSGWWAATQIIPIVNFVMVWVLAFIDWGEPRPLTGSKNEEKIISAWD